jgi:L1 cell adhesion molecule like protein
LNDLPHGFGIETWNDNSRYEGNYSHGKKDGFGKYYWNDGSYYVGNMAENLLSGFGIYHWSDGRVNKLYLIRNILEYGLRVK